MVEVWARAWRAKEASPEREAICRLGRGSPRMFVFITRGAILTQGLYRAIFSAWQIQPNPHRQPRA